MWQSEICSAGPASIDNEVRLTQRVNVLINLLLWHQDRMHTQNEGIFRRNGAEAHSIYTYIHNNNSYYYCDCHYIWVPEANRMKKKKKENCVMFVCCLTIFRSNRSFVWRQSTKTFCRLSDFGFDIRFGTDQMIKSSCGMCHSDDGAFNATPGENNVSCTSRGRCVCVYVLWHQLSERAIIIIITISVCAFVYIYYVGHNRKFAKDILLEWDKKTKNR